MMKERRKAICAEISAQGAEDLIQTTRTRCNGRYQNAYAVIVYSDGKDMAE
jgi:hypothetical protein